MARGESSSRRRSSGEGGELCAVEPELFHRPSRLVACPEGCTAWIERKGEPQRPARAVRLSHGPRVVETHDGARIGEERAAGQELDRLRSRPRKAGCEVGFARCALRGRAGRRRRRRASRSRRTATLATIAAATVRTVANLSLPVIPSPLKEGRKPEVGYSCWLPPFRLDLESSFGKVRGQNAACSHVRPLVEGPTHAGPSEVYAAMAGRRARKARSALLSSRASRSLYPRATSSTSFDATGVVEMTFPVRSVFVKLLKLVWKYRDDPSVSTPVQIGEVDGGAVVGTTVNEFPASPVAELYSA